MINQNMVDCREKVHILGVDISAVDTKSTLAILEDYIREGKPRMVVTADSSAVVLAQHDEELRNIINSADLVTPDSVGILWAAKRFGTPLPERVSGVDIFEFLCERAALNGYKIFLLGAAPGVAEAAVNKLKQRYPGLVVAGTHHGFFGQEESPRVVEKIRACKPDILFVAMGIPKQEKWIAANIHQLQVPVCIGVGGTLDVVSGRVKRAPKWMQDMGLEWLYRLATNPRKIRKCSTLPVFVYLVLRAGRGQTSL
ncbi:MAG: WecB/TagA/CpsF family glycosyltransferase [Armatimonadetes bacterium]|nr:WecB/TagA/CpsF family glycosyltransferase [Armatimonadota bacterium]